MTSDLTFPLTFSALCVNFVFLVKPGSGGQFILCEGTNITLMPGTRKRKHL